MDTTIPQDKPHVSKEKGDFAVCFNNVWYVLTSSFVNTAIFEEEMNVGLFPFLERIAVTRQFKTTDLVNLVFYFDDKRGTEQHTKEDIFQNIRKSGPDAYFSLIEDFGKVALGIKEVDKVVETVQNRHEKRAEESKKKKMKKDSLTGKPDKQ